MKKSSTIIRELFNLPTFNLGKLPKGYRAAETGIFFLAEKVNGIRSISNPPHPKFLYVVYQGGNGSYFMITNYFEEPHMILYQFLPMKPKKNQTEDKQKIQVIYE
jgi:hypothetical protein